MEQMYEQLKKENMDTFLTTMYTTDDQAQSKDWVLIDIANKVKMRFEDTGKLSKRSILGTSDIFYQTQTLKTAGHNHHHNLSK